MVILFPHQRTMTVRSSALIILFLITLCGWNAVEGERLGRFCPQWIMGASPIRLSPSGNLGQCVDVPGISLDDHAPVDTWTCVATALNERWFPNATDSCYFYLRAQHSGKCLSTSGDNIVEQSTCVDQKNQQWLFLPPSPGDGTNAMMFDRMMGKCIAKRDGGWSSGSRFSLVVANGNLSNCETFTTLNCNLLILPGVPMKLSLESEPDQCMEVNGAAQNDNGFVDTWSCGAFSHEEWTAIPMDSCYVRLKVTHSGKVLTSSPDVNGVHRFLVQFGDSSGTNQQWYFELVRRNNFRIYERKQGSCIQRVPGTSGNGGGLQLDFPMYDRSNCAVFILSN